MITFFIFVASIAGLLISNQLFQEEPFLSGILLGNCGLAIAITVFMLVFH